MRVLVTGIAGFIGSHTGELLLRNGCQVMGMDDFSTGKADNLGDYITLGGRYVHCDITLPSMVEVFNSFKPEAIIHLAAQAAISTSIENPIRDMRTNGIGTIRVLQAAKKHGVKRLVIASTSAVYRDDNGLWKVKESTDYGPKSPYGISKVAAEMYTRTLFPNHVILRFGNVYGPRQVPIGENQVIPRMIRHIQHGDQFYIHGDGHQKRDFVYVTDVANACYHALGGASGTYNIASGQAFSVNEIAGMIEEIYGIEGYPWDHTQENDPRRKVSLNVSEAARCLDWKPNVCIREGLKRTVEWWRQDEHEW